MKKIATLFTALLTVVCLMAQSSQILWSDLPTAEMANVAQLKSHLPLTNARVLALDVEGMANHLQKAPMEFTEAAKKKPLELALPLPDGGMAVFGIYEINMMQPGLAAAFPDIKTYAGEMMDDGEVRVRITTGPQGFHATVYWKNTHDIIEAATMGAASQYVSYHLDDAPNAGPLQCGLHHEDENGHHGIAESGLEAMELNVQKSFVTPVTLRTYRLAVATTVEYSVQQGNSVASVLNAVTTVVNQVNAVFEKDNAIRLILIDSTSNAFNFGDADLDPYTNGDPGLMIQQNPPFLNSTFGANAYDIGHVFGKANGGGTVGLASLASVCGDNKARGISNTLGPNFFITVAHEVGHSFNATHTFNLCDGDNENPGTGYEPGGGTTMMAYAGACTTNSVQTNADPYFHINSLERILAFSTGPQGSQCAVNVATNNNYPEADIPRAGGFSIPVQTPFELTGVGTDSDGDMLTYTWEQYDIGPASPLGTPSATGAPPLFRCFPPSANPTRVFPRMQTIVANSPSNVEVLPSTTRDLTFRFTVRDNNGEAGGYAFDEIKFRSNANAGPFLVTSPNAGGEQYTVGEYVEVTWDVANTDGPGVNCQFVDIFLSTDGGFSYPDTLLKGTKNDGSAFVVIPDKVSTVARIKVKASDNIFFDISNANFAINAATDADFTISSYGPECEQVCLPNGFSVELNTAAILGFSEMITFSAAGLPAGVTATFSENPVAPGGSTTMTLELDGSVVDGEYDITVVAEANGVATEERIVTINAVNSDFSALTLDAPKGSAISVLPNYTWTVLPNASAYNIEIATDPGFTNIIDAANDLGANTYTSGITLEENTTYFWRVSAANECGAGDFGSIGAFRTIAQSCTTYPNTSSLSIPSSNGSVVKSTTNVATGGDISEVNVLNLNGQYNAFGDITFALTSPNGTRVNLMDKEPCGSASAFNFGFSDVSPLTDIPCPPPATGVAYQPVGNLSDFVGEDAQGNWELEVKVVTGFGAGGSITAWDLEICGTSAPLDPFLVTNDTLFMQPLSTYTILSNYLEVKDDDNIASELKFTILKDVEAGFISLSGVPLGVGGTFTMKDIYASQVEYTHENGAVLSDHFNFSVEDPTGGFFGLPAFNIVIDENADPNAVKDLLDNGLLSVYPNPTSDVLNIELLDNGNHIEQLSLFNTQGQLMLTQKLETTFGKAQVQLNALPTGIYLLQVQTAKGVASKRVVVEK